MVGNAQIWSHRLFPECSTPDFALSAGELPRARRPSHCLRGSRRGVGERPWTNLKASCLRTGPSCAIFRSSEDRVRSSEDRPPIFRSSLARSSDLPIFSCAIFRSSEDRVRSSWQETSNRHNHESARHLSVTGARPPLSYFPLTPSRHDSRLPGSLPRRLSHTALAGVVVIELYRIYSDTRAIPGAIVP